MSVASKSNSTKPAQTVTVGGVSFSNEKAFALIAGPCVIENADFTVMMAKELSALAKAAGVGYVFKASYDKANRSAVTSYRGPGLEKGLEILARVKNEVGCPVLTDVHWKEDVKAVAAVVDILQIPAFLCRQTDLLLTAGESGKVVNVKKGQFLAPWDMGQVVKKIESTGNTKILLTERGTSFGYNNLVVDMRSLDVMKQWGYPVIYDATHSVQLPGAMGNASGGQREFVLPLARAAVGLGVAALFSEVHPDPDKALSDGPNSLALHTVAGFLQTLKGIDKVTKAL